MVWPGLFILAVGMIVTGVAVAMYRRAADPAGFYARMQARTGIDYLHNVVDQELFFRRMRIHARVSAVILTLMAVLLVGGGILMLTVAAMAPSPAERARREAENQALQRQIQESVVRETQDDIRRRMFGLAPPATQP